MDKSSKKFDIPCFIMICTDKTEQECLYKGLFGDLESRMQYLTTIKEGDIGFLLNLSKDELLGIFLAESKAKLNIDEKAWGGKFPAQIKVKPIGNIQRIPGATSKLEEIIKMSPIRSGKRAPAQNAYGPDITNKILSFFNIPDNLEENKEPEIGTISEYTLDDDVAGLNEIKEFVKSRIIAPFEDIELAYTLKLKIGGGILLVGPPGTGKTLIAMAVAKSIDAKFIEVSPSVIMGYPGEAEKRIENIFSALEKEPRAVVFLDEAEWILNKRMDQTSTVMQRITPVLLSQLSRIFKEKTRPIIFIAATNKPEKIDSAFLRPGRFDRIFYVGLPDEEARAAMIKMKLRGRNNEITDEDINELSLKLAGYSGADIEYIIEEAAYLAFKRKGNIIKNDILESIERTTPSVQSDEVKNIEDWFKSRGLKYNG